MILLDAHSERHRVLRQIHREVVLQLSAVVIQLVLRRKRLKPEGGVVARALEDLDLREPGALHILAALVTLVVADDQVVGLVAEGRIPLTYDRADVLEDCVIGVCKIERRVAAAPEPQAERRRIGNQSRGFRVQEVIAHVELVVLVQIEIDAREEPRRGDSEVIVLVGTGRVVETVLQVPAEGIEIGREDARHGPGGGLATRIRLECRSRLRLVVILVTREEEQLVLDDRSAQRDADVFVVEGPGVEGVRAGVGPHVIVVARVVEHRATELVGAALGDHVDAGTNEIPLPHVVGRNRDLHLLQRVERDRRHTRAVARLSGKTERVVEVGSVDRHVVQAVILPGKREPERHGTVLRGQTEQVLHSAADRRKVLQLLGADGGCGTGPFRADDVVVRRGHRDCGQLDGCRCQAKPQVIGCAQGDGDAVQYLGPVADTRNRHAIRPADTHAGQRKPAVGTRRRRVGRP